jgi:hypothetical protein
MAKARGAEKKKALAHSAKVESPLLYLEWEDAGVLGLGEWMSEADIREEIEHHINNAVVGWLILETPKLLIVAAQKGITEETSRYDLVMRIPKALVRVRRVIKV